MSYGVQKYSQNVLHCIKTEIDCSSQRGGIQVETGTGGSDIDSGEETDRVVEEVG